MSHIKRPAKPWSAPVITLALSMTLLLAVVPRTEAMRIRTPADRKRSEEVWTKAAAPDTTSYGTPQVLVLSRTTSVDHFSSVCPVEVLQQNSDAVYFLRSLCDGISCFLQAQYTQNDTFELRYILVYPTDPPTADSPIFLFCGQETPLT